MVDGVYSADPQKDRNAKRFTRLDYLELINKDLRVMDHTAVTLCKDNDIPIVVFNLGQPGNIEGVILGKEIGTFVGTPKVGAQR
jgi:uridylate kinase